MEEVRFVRAEAEDAKTIACLRQKMWVNTYRGIYPDEMIDQFDFSWHEEQDRKRIESDLYRTARIETVNGENAGYMILKVGQPILLHSLYLLPEYQGKGIGREAFAQIRACCLECGTSSFICQCQPKNQKAMAFYFHMGGKIVSRDLKNEESWQNSVTFRFETGGKTIKKKGSV